MRHRQGPGVDATNIAVKRQFQVGRGSLGHRQRHPQDGIGAKARLVGCAVQVDHDVVDDHLLGRLDAADRFQDLTFDVGDRRPDAFAAIAGFVAVAQLHGLMGAGRRA